MADQEIQLVVQEKWCKHGYINAHFYLPDRNLCNGSQHITVKPDVEIIIKGSVYTVDDIINGLQQIPIIPIRR